MKFLICVDTKERGMFLQKQLGDEKAEYIDAELKNTEKAGMVETMIRKEKFEKRYL